MITSEREEKLSLENTLEAFIFQFNIRKYVSFNDFHVKNDWTKKGLLPKSWRVLFNCKKINTDTDMFVFILFGFPF